MYAWTLLAALFALTLANPLPNADYDGFQGIFDSTEQFCEHMMRETFGADVVKHPGFAAHMATQGLKTRFCDEADQAVQCASGSASGSVHFDLVGDECLTQFDADWRDTVVELKKKFGKSP
ncbi:unnamed protein product, partial [Mesorhabditis spiculigera]